MKTLVKPWIGLVISCVFIPLVYGGLAYWYMVQYKSVPQRNNPLTLAVLLALPLVVAGLPKWWDVWIEPPPKIGSPWTAYSPAEFVTEAFLWHTIAIVVCIIVHLYVNQGLAEKSSRTTLELDVPQARARLIEIEDKLSEARTRLADADDRSMKSSFPVNEPGTFTTDPFDALGDRMEAGREVRELVEEKKDLGRRLKEREETMRFLKEQGKMPGDHYSFLAFGLLWLSALGYSLHSPVNKRFHSGEPIRQR